MNHNDFQEFQDMIKETNNKQLEHNFEILEKEVIYLSRLLLIFSIIQLIFAAGNSIFSFFILLYTIYNVIAIYNFINTKKFINVDLKICNKSYDWVREKKYWLFVIIFWCMCDFALCFYNQDLHILKISQSIYKRKFYTFTLSTQCIKILLLFIYCHILHHVGNFSKNIIASNSHNIEKIVDNFDLNYNHYSNAFVPNYKGNSNKSLSGFINDTKSEN